MPPTQSQLDAAIARWDAEISALADWCAFMQAYERPCVPYMGRNVWPKRLVLNSTELDRLMFARYLHRAGRITESCPLDATPTADLADRWQQMHNPYRDRTLPYPPTIYTGQPDTCPF